MKAIRLPLDLILVMTCVALSACATTPAKPAVTGPQAVKSDPVKSINGSVRVQNPAGETFFIKYRNTTGREIDLPRSISQALTAMGKHETRIMDDAYYVIDVVAQNFEYFDVAQKMRTEEGRQEIKANGVDPVVFALLELTMHPLPTFYRLEADVVIDELQAPPVSRTQETPKIAQLKAPVSIQTQTVLKAGAQYDGKVATEADVIGVMSDNIAQYIGGMFK